MIADTVVIVELFIFDFEEDLSAWTVQVVYWMDRRRSRAWVTKKLLSDVWLKEDGLSQ